MTREDWLLAGATPAQAAQLTPQLTVEQREAVDRVNAEKAEPKPAAKPKRTRKTPPPPRRTSSGNARVPVAAEKTSIPNTDPFQD
jgi:hypothetical protein